MTDVTHRIKGLLSRNLEREEDSDISSRQHEGPYSRMPI